MLKFKFEIEYILRARLELYLADKKFIQYKRVFIPYLKVTKCQKSHSQRAKNDA